MISEYAPGEEYSTKASFLQRNRLIAGLSQVLGGIGGQEKSGTMSTVAHAERYQRPVYAVPGDINRDNASGTNRLIQSGRARMLLGRKICWSPWGSPAPRKPLPPLPSRALPCLPKSGGCWPA